MSVLSAVATASPETSPPPKGAKASDRRADVEAKQVRVAALLEEAGCEGLLVLDQANVAWLTSGAVARSILDPDEMPGLYFTATQRWLLASNVESQRMFDEELDELGFLLKEWPWHWRREQLLTDLCQGKAVAADVAFRDVKVIGNQFPALRRIMTPYEQACYVQLGDLLAHALEATCRHTNSGDSEREVAGQISHRLIHRGVVPVSISVAADGRPRQYRRHGFTSAPVRRYCLVAATARKFGLHAMASRAFSFGPPEDGLKKEQLAVCRVAATYTASTWPDAVIQEIFNAGKRVYQLTDYEHEWQRSPQGHVVGRAPVELTLMPDSTDLLRTGWAITWWPTVGAAASADTYLVTETGPQPVTPADNWPVVSVHVSGAEFHHPYILER